MKPRTAILSFLCVEAVLYAAFLALDLTGRGGDTIVLKYTGVLLCLAFSLLCALQGGDRLVPPALALTALADLFLLVLNQWYALGIVLFLGVQSAYLIRLRLAAGQTWFPIRAGLPLLAAEGKGGRTGRQVPHPRGDWVAAPRQKQAGPQEARPALTDFPPLDCAHCPGQLTGWCPARR